MNISNKKIENNHIKLIVKIVKNDYGTKVQESLKDYQKKMNLPGFRVGKVPMSIVKSKYELAIRAEEINKILSSTIDEYIKKNQIDHHWKNLLPLNLPSSTPDFQSKQFDRHFHQYQLQY